MYDKEIELVYQNKNSICKNTLAIKNYLTSDLTIPF